MPLPLDYNLKGLRVRRVSTLLTIGGIALVVVIFVAVMGIAQGLRHVYTSSGAFDNLIFVRAGATSPVISRLGEDAVGRLRFLPEIAKDAAGAPLMSAEAVEGIYLQAGGKRLPVTVRGVDPLAFEIRRQVRITDGRAPERLSYDILVGAALARRIGGLRSGSTLRLNGPTPWRVSGFLHAEGGVAESEIWMDRLSLMRERNRDDFNYVIARVNAPDLAAAHALEKKWEEDPALGVRIVVESDYYSRQTEASDTLRMVCMILVAVMGLAMVITGTNTFYAMIAARIRELGTLRVIGFARRDIVLSVLFEAALLGFVGGVLGAVLGGLTNGLPFFYDGVLLSFRIGPSLLLAGTLIATLLGALGGTLPALRASRLEVVEALHTL